MQKTNERKSSGKTVCPNVLAINASPHRNTGNTAQILNPFLEGMREKCANVELFCTEDLAINSCKGDLTCMIRSDGRCIHRDDMDILIPKLRAADILVLASPLYVDDVTGPMKTLMDRMVPILQVFIETREGHTRHPLKESRMRRVILVSSCGFWEQDNFEVIVAHMRAFAKNITAEFSGALLRPHAASLKGMLALGAPIQDIPDAAREAGRQMVTENRISSALLETISRPLVMRDIYQQTSNQHFMEMTLKIQQDAGEVPGCRKGVL